MQGLCNGRVSIRPSVRPSVSPVDRQQQRRAAGLLLSSGACSRYLSIAAGVRAVGVASERHIESRSMRLNTDLLAMTGSGSHS